MVHVLSQIIAAEVPETNVLHCRVETSESQTEGSWTSKISKRKAVRGMGACTGPRSFTKNSPWLTLPEWWGEVERYFRRNRQRTSMMRTWAECHRGKKEGMPRSDFLTNFLLGSTFHQLGGMTKVLKTPRQGRSLLGLAFQSKSLVVKGAS